MADAPTPDEINALLGETGSLDEAAPETESTEYGPEFEAAAMTAVGSKLKARALKDAITACLKEHGLLQDTAEESSEEEPALGQAADVSEADY